MGLSSVPGCDDVIDPAEDVSAPFQVRAYRAVLRVLRLPGRSFSTLSRCFVPWRRATTKTR